MTKADGAHLLAVSLQQARESVAKASCLGLICTSGVTPPASGALQQVRGRQATTRLDFCRHQGFHA